MQPAQLTFVFSILATLVSADAHLRGICVDVTSSATIYNAEATKAACEAYKNETTKSAYYDFCPDCVMAEGSSGPFCASDSQRIGGVEITAFCRAAGADNALTS